MLGLDSAVAGGVQNGEKLATALLHLIYGSEQLKELVVDNNQLCALPESIGAYCGFFL